MSDDQPAHEAFGLLSDDTRVAILRAVAVAEHERDPSNPGPAELSFSEIYDRVDVDNTSKLSYHLGELVGTFLRKTDDGYAFTYAGERLARFVLSGNYHSPPAFDPEPVAGACVFCGERALEATLSTRFFRVDCTACERPVADHPVTPAQVRGLDAAEMVRSVERTSSHLHRQVQSGTCPECGGGLATDVLELETDQLPDADPFVAISRCAACLRRYSLPLTYRVAYHPASIAFHWDRSVDVTARGIWRFHEHVYEGRWTSERVGTDPDAYEVTLRHGDDALRARLDANADVVRTERVRREG